MRALTPAFADLLAGGVTTLCHCWRLSPRNHSPMGFTDHDMDLTFGGITYTALSGVDATLAESTLGLSVGGAEISGALRSDAITEQDLANGIYDGASIETWLVNWSDVEQRQLLDIGSLGEVMRSEHTFTAEIRTIAHELDQVRGRLYQAGCAASLGDAECKVPLSSSPLLVTGSVSGAGSRLECRADLGEFPAGWFSGGVLRFLDGVNAATRTVIKDHTLSDGLHLLTFWTPLTQASETGDTFQLTAGCDKTFTTCAEKFSNQANFRGFPHMPGVDIVAFYPARNEPQMDGGSLFR